MRRSLPLLALIVPAVLAAQATGKATYAGGWMARADESNDDMSKFKFDPMGTGWHVVSGPVHAILYRPATTAAGNFTATLHAGFFGPPGQYPEGYGLFVGGHDLSGPAQRYLYFVVANDGRYLIKKRSGENTSTVVDWTAAAAIKRLKAGDPGNVENVLGVIARADSVIFTVNGTAVAARPRGELVVDGVVGARINHSLSIHITSLTVSKNK